MNSELAERLAALGSQLRQLRTDAGMTQNQLAHSINVSQATISTCETGSAPTTTDVLMRWIAACNGALSMRSESQNPVEWAMLMKAARALDSDDLRRLAMISQGISKVPESFKEGMAMAFAGFAGIGVAAQPQQAPAAERKSS